MIATVWTKKLCGACQEEKDLLRAEGYEVVEMIVEDEAGMDRDAFAQLHCQDGYFPVVRIDGIFRVPAMVSKILEW